MDHGAEGIRVNAVCPRPIFTPFHARRLQAAGQTVAQYNEDAARKTMLKRPGTAEEVAACVLFLASSDAVCHRLVAVRRWRNDRHVNSAGWRGVMGWSGRGQ